MSRPEGVSAHVCVSTFSRSMKAQKSWLRQGQEEARKCDFSFDYHRGDSLHNRGCSRTAVVSGFRTWVGFDPWVIQNDCLQMVPCCPLTLQNLQLKFTFWSPLCWGRSSGGAGQACGDFCHMNWGLEGEEWALQGSQDMGDTMLRPNTITQTRTSCPEGPGQSKMNRATA